MSAASWPRRRFLGLSLGAAATFTPFGALLARAAAPPAVYHLPFPGGVVWRVGQGVKGGFSHQGRASFAWDFFMPSGSAITARPAGVDSMVQQGSEQPFRDLSCP